MKKRFLFILLFVPLSLYLFGDNEAAQQINLEYQHQHGSHTEYFDPADKPEVYYDRDNQEIILVADGFASSYDVDIFSMSSMQCVLYTTISGYGDTIDVSSLPNDDYKIVISTPYHNIYEGYFTNY